MELDKSWKFVRHSDSGPPLFSSYSESAVKVLHIVHPSPAAPQLVALDGISLPVPVAQIPESPDKPVFQTAQLPIHNWHGWTSHWPPWGGEHNHFTAIPNEGEDNGSVWKPLMRCHRSEETHKWKNRSPRNGRNRATILGPSAIESKITTVTFWELTYAVCSHYHIDSRMHFIIVLVASVLFQTFVPWFRKLWSMV